MMLQQLAESIWPLSGHSHFDLGTGIVSRIYQRGITHQGPAKMFCTLHPELSCYLMGCDCNVYMHGECGHFQLGHSLGLRRSAFDQQEPPGVVSASLEEAPMSHPVECSPPTPEAWVQSPLLVAWGSWTFRYTYMF